MTESFEKSEGYPMPLKEKSVIFLLEQQNSRSVIDELFDWNIMDFAEALYVSCLFRCLRKEERISLQNRRFLFSKYKLLKQVVCSNEYRIKDITIIQTRYPHVERAALMPGIIKALFRRFKLVVKKMLKMV